MHSTLEQAKQEHDKALCEYTQASFFYAEATTEEEREYWLPLMLQSLHNYEETVHNYHNMKKKEGCKK